jgi:hypothetical protein
MGLDLIFIFKAKYGDEGKILSKEVPVNKVFLMITNHVSGNS